ncbi:MULTISPECIES: MerR family transcriptional regulator [Paenibacillus]|uniref:DNA-binding transcriptional MerR regulator n=1 Tax=Paenibacillus lactis TaxID=228574 RepID=A0ABS4FDG4_9BACL|nr:MULTISPECIES: MerR family transcriptional regulator [Paenibacillus]MBP1894258.1 DNA-binding transcriptional MerR regulator [Paenibacillus lactis]GIO89388.1 MerR family transcriptional regulator [Paenibacillus lactis]HAF99565.1 MerR family DNA-binding transcriptional regulator [Paenibacillus lactis]
MGIRPIEIARKLGISTSALRHYESWGIVPPTERTASGYRIYTEEHAAYFECIRAMFPGFGVDVTKKVMKKLQEKELDEALWIINEVQARLHRDKTLAERTIRILETEQLDDADSHGRKDKMTIGEVAAETGVEATAIRHWEKEGVITLPRDEENGYRTFNRALVRQILIIRILRSANYPLEVIKDVLQELQHHQVHNARRLFKETLVYLNHLNHHQIRGVHYVYRLCEVLKLI